MSNVRDLTNKINSLRNMQKVMHAMNMIASIKLRKLYALQTSLALFNSALDEIHLQLGRFFAEAGPPMAAETEDSQKVHIIMFTADKGLCGAHNNSVNKAVDLLVKQNSKAGHGVDITCLGNKGAQYCKRKEYTVFQQAEINERVLGPGDFHLIVQNIIARYNDNEIQQLYTVSNLFHSTLHQETVTLQLLPFSLSEQELAKPEAAIMTTEPAGAAFSEAAAELYIYYKLNSILYNSYLSEHSSRMTAMENAVHNSEDLIDKYVTVQNRSRQSAITAELSEIVSGKEALKG